MLEMRLTNFRSGVGEVQTVWKFVPLRFRALAPKYLRDDRTNSEGGLNRRPYAEQSVRSVIFGAGVLNFGKGPENFERFQRAHAIEFKEVIAGKTVWTEYAPEIESQIELSFLEDIDQLAWCELTFIEKTPRYFHTWYK